MFQAKFDDMRFLDGTDELSADDMPFAASFDDALFCTESINFEDPMGSLSTEQPQQPQPRQATTGKAMTKAKTKKKAKAKATNARVTDGTEPAAKRQKQTPIDTLAMFAPLLGCLLYTSPSPRD